MRSLSVMLGCAAILLACSSLFVCGVHAQSTVYSLQAAAYYQANMTKVSLFSQREVGDQLDSSVEVKTLQIGGSLFSPPGQIEYIVGSLAITHRTVHMIQMSRRSLQTGMYLCTYYTAPVPTEDGEHVGLNATVVTKLWVRAAAYCPVDLLWQNQFDGLFAVWNEPTYTTLGLLDAATLLPDLSGVGSPGLRQMSTPLLTYSSAVHDFSNNLVFMLFYNTTGSVPINARTTRYPSAPVIAVVDMVNARHYCYSIAEMSDQLTTLVGLSWSPLEQTFFAVAGEFQQVTGDTALQHTRVFKTTPQRPTEAAVRQPDGPRNVAHYRGLFSFNNTIAVDFLSRPSDSVVRPAVDFFNTKSGQWSGKWLYRPPTDWNTDADFIGSFSSLVYRVNSPAPGFLWPSSFEGDC